jgi:CubicO group peptidase (beta-lactamase class C family)
MRLVEQGRTTLDTPVMDVLPEFRVADADLTKRVTLRHLLAHVRDQRGPVRRYGTRRRLP